MARIPLLEPSLTGNERAYLDECIDTGFVSSVGPFVRRFEDEFAAWLGLGADHAVACASGTAAIHLALVAHGVGPGDEVWVSDLTFIASANPVSYCGASVVLVDSEPESWNLDPDLVAEELSRRPRPPAAIVAVDLLGHPARLDALVAAAQRHGVAVIEDAAEALGATWTTGPLAGRQAGTGAATGCFSFNGNKVLTTGGGGMVVTADRERARLMRHLSTQARLPGVGYDHDMIGFNYRLSNIAAAVGLAQLEQLDGFVARKRAIAHRYDKAFAGVDAIGLAPRCTWAERSAWLYSITLPSLDERERVRLALDAAGIEARPVWTPLHRHKPYRDVAVLGGGAVADDIADRALSLPSSPGLGGDDQAEVIDVVLRAAA